MFRAQDFLGRDSGTTKVSGKSALQKQMCMNEFVNALVCVYVYVGVNKLLSHIVKTHTKKKNLLDFLLFIKKCVKE